jgi:predicted Zn-dependent protease
LNAYWNALAGEDAARAYGAVRKLAASPDQAIPYLEERLRLEWKDPSAHSVRTLRALEVLELAGTQQARQVLQELAKGAPEAQLTQEAKAALERLARRVPALP